MDDEEHLRERIDRLEKAIWGNDGGITGLMTTVAIMHQTLKAVQDDITVRKQNSFTLNINLLATAALLLMWLADKFLGK